jgi:hypothetical protein
MAKQKQPPGEPMDLANMRSLGVRGLAVKCLQPACLHAAIVSVDDYPDDMLVRDFAKRMRGAWVAFQAQAARCPMCAA